MANVNDYTLEDILPCNVDAEKTILGAIIKDNETFYDDTIDIQAEDFYLDSHRKIFMCINEVLFGMVEGIRHIDEMTLAEELRKRKWLEHCFAQFDQ